MKTYVLGTELQSLEEALLFSIHNICFHEEIRKISAFFGQKKKRKKKALSGAHTGYERNPVEKTNVNLPILLYLPMTAEYNIKHIF